MKIASVSRPMAQGNSPKTYAVAQPVAADGKKKNTGIFRGVIFNLFSGVSRNGKRGDLGFVAYD